MKILLIDNYDSFTFNLKHLVLECDESIDLTVIRNDEGVLKKLAENEYEGIIIGPGPGNPDDDAYFGENKQVILKYGLSGTPVLGICLGFQGIFSTFGGTLKVCNVPVHGKVSALNIVDPGVMLEGIQDGDEVMRYHSIIADPDTLPEQLRITAYATEESPSFKDNGVEVMAIEHRDAPIYGIQFHPESFATTSGHDMMRNFIKACNKDDS